MTMTPYYADNMVTLYHGDMREVLPALDIRPDLCVADPPYAETSLAWDRWPDGWPAVVADVTSSLWCFGSMRMFLDHRGEFGAWKLSQDVVWRKNAGTGLHVDRFRRIHEHATHWYRGPWGDVYKATPRIRSENPVRSDASQRDGALRGQHMGSVHRKTTWVDTGTRLAPSVIDAKNLRGFALHPTEKPPGILAPLIEYACPEGGCCSTRSPAAAPRPRPPGCPAVAPSSSRPTNGTARSSPADSPKTCSRSEAHRDL